MSIAAKRLRISSHSETTFAAGARTAALPGGLAVAVLQDMLSDDPVQLPSVSGRKSLQSSAIE